MWSMLWEQLNTERSLSNNTVQTPVPNTEYQSQAPTCYHWATAALIYWWELQEKEPRAQEPNLLSSHDRTTQASDWQELPVGSMGVSFSQSTLVFLIPEMASLLGDWASNTISNIHRWQCLIAISSAWNGGVQSSAWDFRVGKEEGPSKFGFRRMWISGGMGDLKMPSREWLCICWTTGFVSEVTSFLW